MSQKADSYLLTPPSSIFFVFTLVSHLSINCSSQETDVPPFKLPSSTSDTHNPGIASYVPQTLHPHVTNPPNDTARSSNTTPSSNRQPTMSSRPTMSLQRNLLLQHHHHNNQIPILLTLHIHHNHPHLPLRQRTHILPLLPKETPPQQRQRLRKSPRPPRQRVAIRRCQYH